MQNRQRLLALLQILRRYSDEEHPLSTGELADLLENEYGLEDAYRKTINRDLRDLMDFFDDYQLNYRHKSGYSLSESPFSLAEVKILLDSLDSLTMLDETFLRKLKDKLLSFLSLYEGEMLEELRIEGEHEPSHFIYHLETLLNAYRHSHTVRILRNGKEEAEEILPLFFERVRGQYYLLYRYPQKKKIYRLRFDNIAEVSETASGADLSSDEKEIRSWLKEASDAYHGGKRETVTLAIEDPDPKLRRWLKEDFPAIRFYENRAVLTAALNERFFARIAAYGRRIRIESPPEAAEAFARDLKEILELYGE